MPSDTYRLFRQAILNEKPVRCVYQGYARELCPVILGYKKSGEERVLAYQFGSGSSQGLAPGGAWKCFFVSQVEDAAIFDGPWHEGERHERTQTCVDIVDLDINIHVRKRR
jgi:hypothetical protein